jgi:hypothetical protein
MCGDNSARQSQGGAIAILHVTDEAGIRQAFGKLTFGHQLNAQENEVGTRISLVQLTGVQALGSKEIGVILIQ